MGLLSAAALIVFAVLAAFTRYALRRPQAASRSISTLTLLITHAQTVSVAGSLALKWPALFTRLLALVSLNPLNLPSVSCLLDTSEDESMEASTKSFGVLALSMTLGSLALLLLPLIVYAVARVYRLRDLEDNSELALSMIFTFQLTLSWNSARGVLLSVLRWRASEGVEVILSWETENKNGIVIPGSEITAKLGEASSQEYATMVLAPMLFALQLVLAVRFLGRIRSFKRGVDSGEWRLGGGGACEGCSPCPGVHRSSGRLMARSLFTSEPIAPRRLATRVNFLTGRFAAHAPRWQLVIWARQLALFFVVLTLNVLNESTHTTEPDQWQRVVFGGVALIILLVAWCYHARTQPYAYRYAEHSSADYGWLTLIAINLHQSTV